MPHIIPAADHAEWRGRYQEAVAKIVDGLEEGVRNGELITRRRVLQALGEIVTAHEWIRHENLAIHVLLWSPRAIVGHLMSHAKSPRSGPFPFGIYARDVLLHDTQIELSGRPFYRELH